MKKIKKEKALSLLKKTADWRLAAGGRAIAAEWAMKDFLSAVQLIRKIAVLAEKMDHHPDVHLTGYRKLKIELSTHAVGGLTRKDFILASQIDRLPKKLKIV